MDLTKIRKKIEAAQAAYEAEVHTSPTARVRELANAVKDAKAELSRAITDGASACPDCDSLPIGIHQPVKVGSTTMLTFEVGCINCKDHRARGLTREQAVENWNMGPSESLDDWTGWVKPKAEPAPSSTNN